jgi:hypothetical protein
MAKQFQEMRKSLLEDNMDRPGQSRVKRSLWRAMCLDWILLRGNDVVIIAIHVIFASMQLGSSRKRRWDLRENDVGIFAGMTL